MLLLLLTSSLNMSLSAAGGGFRTARVSKSMSRRFRKDGGSQAGVRSSSSHSFGGDHVRAGVTGEYVVCGSHEEDTRLLTYKTASLNYINSNHVNHHIVHGSRRHGNQMVERLHVLDPSTSGADFMGVMEEIDEHDCKVHGCERVRINVSGQYFETRIGLLNRHPETLLGNAKKRQRFYDRSRDEYFIDRHRPSFEAVFSYYQYGGKPLSNVH